MPADLDITAISAAANDTIDKAAAELSLRINADLELQQRIASLIYDRFKDRLKHARYEHIKRLASDIIAMVRNASIKQP